MTAKIELKELEARPTLSIRKKLTIEELPKTIGESYMKIANYMTELGVPPTSEPFTAFHSMDMPTMDVELGFPLQSPLSGKGEIVAGEIPADTMVTSMYKGPYAGMEAAYKEIMEWIEENGYELKGVYYEYYYNSPMEVPESDLLTRIELPVKKK